MRVIRQGAEQGALLSKAGYPAAIDDAINQVTGGWFAKQIPCGFLKDDKCSIYEHRPSACSTYYVVTSPELCSYKGGTGKRDIKSLDNSEIQLKIVTLDAEFVGSLIGRGPVLAPPIPLGVAVSYGLTLLTEGVEAMFNNANATLMDPGKILKNAEEKPQTGG